MNSEKLRPNFLIIGANKAGTSSIHRYIGQHPDIFTTDVKEPMHFCLTDPEKPEDSGCEKINEKYARESYRKLFDACGGKKWAAESSTAYLANPMCAERIYNFNPNMKIIACLRQPIDRAYSNWKMYVRWGIEKLGFEESVCREMMYGADDRMQGMRYLTLGLYSKSLMHYIDVFGRENILILFYDNFAHDAKAFCRQIYHFLGVDEEFNTDVSVRHNVGKSNQSAALPYLSAFRRRHPRVNKYVFSHVDKALSLRKPNTDKIATDLRRQLLDWYEQEFVALEKLLHVSLTSWRR